MTENKRFRIYQDLYEDFYIEDIESYNNQKLQRSYKVGNEEDVKYENVENIVDLLNEQEELIKRLKEELFEARKDYIVDTADISDKTYLDEMIEEERKEIYGDVE